MADSRPLYMVKMEMAQPDLMRLGRERGLPMREVDLGYLVHCLLGELFGDDAPAPFDIRSASGRTLEVLAYTTSTKEALRRHADTFAEPGRHEVLKWPRLRQKTMPEKWPENGVLGFEIRVCPVVRAASDTEHYSQGSEVDAFLTWCAESAEDEDVPGREEIYRDWLADQLERRGGAQLLDAEMTKFRLRKLTRRTHGSSRKSRVFTRPDARFSGRFRIVEPARLSDMLEAGIGRHRSFGFGMVLLRPAT